MPRRTHDVAHPRVPRRVALQAGAISLLGVGMNHVAGLRTLAAEGNGEVPLPRKSVIYVFLSGGLAQHDSFDPKPQAPDSIRGEFSPIATRTPGIQICAHQDMYDLKMEAPIEIRGSFRPIATNVPEIEICEHMPRLAKMMDKVAIIRSLYGCPDQHASDLFTTRRSSPRSTTGSASTSATRRFPTKQGGRSIWSTIGNRFGN